MRISYQQRVYRFLVVLITTTGRPIDDFVLVRVHRNIDSLCVVMPWGECYTIYCAHIKKARLQTCMGLSIIFNKKIFPNCATVVQINTYCETAKRDILVHIFDCNCYIPFLVKTEQPFKPGVMWFEASQCVLSNIGTTEDQ